MDNRWVLLVGLLAAYFCGLYSWVFLPTYIVRVRYAQKMVGDWAECWQLQVLIANYLTRAGSERHEANKQAARLILEQFEVDIYDWNEFCDFMTASARQAQSEADERARMDKDRLAEEVCAYYDAWGEPEDSSS